MCPRFPCLLAKRLHCAYSTSSPFFFPARNITRIGECARRNNNVPFHCTRPPLAHLAFFFSLSLSFSISFPLCIRLRCLLCTISFDAVCSANSFPSSFPFTAPNSFLRGSGANGRCSLRPATYYKVDAGGGPCGEASGETAGRAESISRFGE